MTGTRLIGAYLPLITKLLENDPNFKAGTWYERSKYSGGRQPKMFAELVRRVENQTPGFL